MRLIDKISRSFKNLKNKKKRSRKLILSVALGTFSVFMMLTLSTNLSNNINKLTKEYDKYKEIYVRAPISIDVAKDIENEIDPISGEQTIIGKDIDLSETENILNKFKNKYKGKLGDSYKLYNTNLNIAHMDNYIACTCLMAVSRNSLPEIKNENGAWVSRSFLDHITTLNNYQNNTITKEKIDIIGKKVSFDLRYFTYNENVERKEQVKKAAFIIEGILNNDNYLFDIPARYDIEAKTDDFYNINKTVMYVPAEYIDKLYTELPLKGDKQELKRLINDDISYGKLVFKSNSIDNIPAIVNDIKKLGYNIEGSYYEASMLNGITMIVYLIFGCIGLIILIVSSIGIINVMLMAVMERKKEIYILKVMGGKNRDIKSLFLFEAGFIGLIGSFAGVLLSLIIIFILNHILSEYYIIINFYIIFITVSLSIFLSIMAAVPSIIILKKDYFRVSRVR